jgi:hypothetical protein
VRIPAGSARTVDGVSRRPWCLFPRMTAHVNAGGTLLSF